MKYIGMGVFASDNCVDIKEIEVFNNFAKENNINTVFYGERTSRNITGKCFLFALDAVFYVFTYQSRYGEYRSIEDYISGLKQGFDNALDYYFAKNRKIDNYNDFSKYLLNEYSINDTAIKNYEINNAYDTTGYYLKCMKIADEIEAIKEKHGFNSSEGVICYNIINNLERGKEYTVNGLYSICLKNIGNSVYEIKIHDDFEDQFQKYVEKKDAFSKVIKGEWELDTDAFRAFMDKKLEMLDVKIEYHDEEAGEG